MTELRKKNKCSGNLLQYNLAMIYNGCVQAIRFVGGYWFFRFLSFGFPHEDGDVIVAAGNLQREEVVGWIMLCIPVLDTE